MKTFIKINIIALLSISTILTTACRVASNDLMQGASPSTSALALYHYDGETVTRTYVFERNEIQQVLDELSAVKIEEVDEWSLGDLTLPMYGFRIGSTTGTPINAAWSNGYWIDRDGKAYSFDFDFEKLQQDYNWTNTNWFSSFTVFPNARTFTIENRGWDSRFLTTAPSINPPAGISMTLNSWENNSVSVYITNENDTEWMYGQHFEIHVLLNNIWYDIPVDKDNWVFTDEGLIVQAGETIEHNYNLLMYGHLPAGTYRIVAYGLFVENTITNETGTGSLPHQGCGLCD